MRSSDAASSPDLAVRSRFGFGFQALESFPLFKNRAPDGVVDTLGSFFRARSGIRNRVRSRAVGVDISGGLLGFGPETKSCLAARIPKAVNNQKHSREFFPRAISRSFRDRWTGVNDSEPLPSSSLPDRFLRFRFGRSYKKPVLTDTRIPLLRGVPSQRRLLRYSGSSDRRNVSERVGFAVLL